MPPKPSQFEPGQQFDSLMIELESELATAGAKIARLAFLREKIAAEHAALQAAVDALGFYTEEEAAAVLKIEARLLRDLRKRHNLPHTRFSKYVRYTPDHVREIVAILEMNGNRREALPAAKLKLAA